MMPAKDDNSTVEPRNSSDGNSMLAGPDSRMNKFDPVLDAQLQASRAYLRTEHRRSTSSIISKQDSMAGFSIFSGFSLADVSNISVISLPMIVDELWNSEHYQDLGMANSHACPKRPAHSSLAHNVITHTNSPCPMEHFRSTADEIDDITDLGLKEHYRPAEDNTMDLSNVGTNQTAIKSKPQSLGHQDRVLVSKILRYLIEPLRRAEASKRMNRISEANGQLLIPRNLFLLGEGNSLTKPMLGR